MIVEYQKQKLPWVRQSVDPYNCRVVFKKPEMTDDEEKIKSSDSGQYEEGQGQKWHCAQWFEKYQPDQ